MAVLAGALCKGVHSVAGDGGLELVLVVVCLRGVHHGCAPLCHIGVLAGAMVVVCQCTGLCV
jgi:hypothetical protein